MMNLEFPIFLCRIFHVFEIIKDKLILIGTQIRIYGT